MKYFSTRGGDERLSFEQTVLTGLAPNGGLYIPVSLPRLPPSWSSDWSQLPFTTLALEIYSLFISPDEISRSDLSALIQKSYSTFRHPDIAPLHQIGDKEWVLELFHGPTFAFKDVALQFLGNLFEYFLSRRNEGKAGDKRERVTVVGATSGDTGSAAIYGLRNKSDLSIFILHPHGRVSPIQEAQMTTVLDANVFNLAVTGTFDDCQDIVKALFSDSAFNAHYHLGAINSINWARILAQIVYYFSSYFQLLKKLGLSVEEAQKQGVKVRYTVPTGNFGDILAGWYAKRLGLPMEKLVIATNSNDILTRFWKTGRYEKADSSASSSSNTPTNVQTAPVNGSTDGGQSPSNSSGGVIETLSPAMDILVSSNFERLLWYLAFESLSPAMLNASPSSLATAAGRRASVHAGDLVKGVADTARGEVDGGLRAKMGAASEKVGEWMKELKSKGRFEVGGEAWEAMKREFEAEKVNDGQTQETIKRHFQNKDSYGSYIADPHTAVGLEASRRVISAAPSSSTHTITLSTAHPAKFSSAVESALSSEPGFNFDKDVLPEEFRGLLDKERRVIRVDGVEVEKTKEVVEREVAKLWRVVQEDGGEKGTSL